MADDDFEDLWELAEFTMREAYALRSFLEYLRTWPDSPIEKFRRIEEWRKRVGGMFGDPALVEATPGLQRLRDQPPEVRKEAIRLALARAHEMYFSGSE